MIDRDIEKALHLLGVQIHGQNTIHTGGEKKIRDELRRNWNARLILTILARVAKEGNDRRDPIGAGAPRGVNHDEQLHQVLIGRGAGGLNDENIVAPNVFLDSDVGLAIGKGTDGGLPERHTDVSANAQRQLAIG